MLFECTYADVELILTLLTIYVPTHKFGLS
jgi:hypothetical protein